MRQVICTRARLGTAVGTVVDVPDGAEVSPLYYAELGSLGAAAAQAHAPAAPAAPDAPEPEPPGVPLAPKPAAPLTGAPDAKGM